jgi:hypothetical protein
MIPNKRIEVFWNDAYTYDPWEEKDSAIETCKPMMPCRTIGWLIDESKDHITICHTYNPKSVMGTLHIPKGCITKMKVQK